MEKETKTPMGSSEVGRNTVLQDLEENVKVTVKSCISAFQADGSLSLSEVYEVDRALAAAFTLLNCLKDPTGCPILEQCSAESITTALLDMAIQGLSVNKRQCRFAVSGGDIKLVRTYFGTIALAREVGGMIGEPIVSMIGQGDDFEFETDVITGKKRLIRHRPALCGMGGEIAGAYCILHLSDGTQYLEVFGPLQISAMLGVRQEDMVRVERKTVFRTVINRACRNLIESSANAYMYECMYDEWDLSTTNIGSQTEVNEPANITENILDEEGYNPAEQEKTQERPVW